MLPETHRDRFVYLGVIPLLAAIGGSVIGALFQAQSCSVIGASEVRSLLENTELSGLQKIEFMDLYLQLTDRPWAIARSVLSFLTMTGMFLLGLFAVSGGFRRR